MIVVIHHSFCMQSHHNPFPFCARPFVTVLLLGEHYQRIGAVSTRSSDSGFLGKHQTQNGRDNQRQQRHRRHARHFRGGGRRRERRHLPSRHQEQGCPVRGKGILQQPPQDGNKPEGPLASGRYPGEPQA